MKRVSGTDGEPEAKKSCFPLVGQVVLKGGFLFFSGLLPVDRETGLVEDCPIEGQVARVFTHLDRLLEVYTCTTADIVKVSVFMLDVNEGCYVLEYLRGVNSALQPIFFSAYTMPSLPMGARIEIEATAISPDAFW